MATSSKTSKADPDEKTARSAKGSAKKAAGSARKADSARQTASGSRAKSNGSGRKAVAGSGRQAAGSGRQTAGSGRKAASGSSAKAAGSGRKATASSGRQTGSSGRKTTAGSGRQAASSGRKSAAGSSRQAASSGRKSAAGSSRQAAGSGRKTTAGSSRQSAGSSRKAADAASKASSGAGRKTGTGTRSKTGGSGSRADGSKQQKGFYIYGIVPADVELADEMPGVGDPPGQIRVIRSDGLAALVSEVDLSRQLGSPDDLMAHKDILDASAAELPVLPLRFGAVLTSEEAVAEELLAAHRDEFTEALDELDGRAQFVVKGRYVEDTILGEVLSENKQAARLAERIHGQNSDATRDARIQLGEMINSAVTAKREADTRALGEAMEGHCAASVVRDPTHELDAVHVAFLVDSDQESDMEAVLEDLAGAWDGRIEMRLLGPMAAYDFVHAAAPEG
jgi:Gas vesicle synthesis protein GvpL/GvpF